MLQKLREILLSLALIIPYFVGWTLINFPIERERLQGILNADLIFIATFLLWKLVRGLLFYVKRHKVNQPKGIGFTYVALIVTSLVFLVSLHVLKSRIDEHAFNYSLIGLAALALRDNFAERKNFEIAFGASLIATFCVAFLSFQVFEPTWNLPCLIYACAFAFPLSGLFIVQQASANNLLSTIPATSSSSSEVSRIQKVKNAYTRLVQQKWVTLHGLCLFLGPLTILTMTVGGDLPESFLLMATLLPLAAKLNNDLRASGSGAAQINKNAAFYVLFFIQIVLIRLFFSI